MILVFKVQKEIKEILVQLEQLVLKEIKAKKEILVLLLLMTCLLQSNLNLLKVLKEIKEKKEILVFKVFKV